jgi:hypothetical protein
MSEEQHPIDRALAALGDAISLALASDKPSKFAEIGRLTSIANKLGALRPARGVDDVQHVEEYEADGGGVMMANPGPMPLGRRFNDGADLNREMIMLAQGFLREYADIEKMKASRPVADGRLLEVSELSELYELRAKLALQNQQVPPQIDARIEALLKRIGETPNGSESPGSQSSAILPAEPLRGHPPDGAGQPDGDRVGELVADRA